MVIRDPGASPPDTGEAARPDRRSRLSPGHGMTITAMVTTVALLGTGGIAAWQVGQMRLPAARREHQPGRARHRESPASTYPASGSHPVPAQPRPPRGHRPARAP